MTPPARFGFVSPLPPRHGSTLRIASVATRVVEFVLRAGSVFSLLAASAGLTSILSGCATASSPLSRESERQLKQSIAEAAARELADAAEQPKSVVTTREEGVTSLDIRPDILQELQGMAGPRSYELDDPRLGLDLTGRNVRTVSVSLERVLRSVVTNNLAVQFARIGPALAESQLVAAEAAFDWTFFSNLNYTNTDSPQASATSLVTNQSQTVQTQAGLRRQLIGGGRFTLQTDLQYIDTATAGITPNPANNAGITAQWDQPLLRNFGSDVTQAEIRLARNDQRERVQLLKRDLIRTSTDAERAYWQLVRSVADLKVLQRLVKRGEEVRDQVKARAMVDANAAQIADATARVERRKADVLRAQTQVRLLSDQLKTFMNDPDIPPGSELVLLPVEDAVDEPIKFSLLESLRTAMQNRPEVQQAILSIDDSSIRQTVADNQRLPDLSMRLQTRFAGLDNEPLRAYEDAVGGNFIDYLAGLNFEMPIGNRRAEAQFRQRRLERMQSVLSYRNTVQQVVGEVKTALNRLTLNYSLIEQVKTSRTAATENLRVLLVEKEQGGGFTVERLDIELNRQESLAASEREENEALAEYNIAIAELFQAMGTTLERNNVEFVVPGGDEPREP
jgi:outer membrane protein